MVIYYQNPWFYIPESVVWSSNMHNLSVKRVHKNDWFSYTGYCQDVTYLTFC